jgi:hypothetical protein
MMKRLLKVGIEFEFNLPEQTGTCKGDNNYCPCKHLEEGCWQECTNIDTCKKIPCIETCASRDRKCTAEKCKNCKDYKFKCIGITCVDFTSTCFKCDKFGRDCNTCGKRYNPNRDPKNIRNTLSSEFKPSKNYGKVSKSGVVSITTDGSLLGDKGVEIITVGRRVDYWEFYNMSRRILEKVTRAGGYINERTSIHMHVLTSYYKDQGANELEKPMPQIVLANFHQLCRRYQNALTWMTIGLDDPNHMTRWEKFRVSILGISPVTITMRNLVNEVSRNSGGSKYGFVNYNKTGFVNSDIDRFHVEFRESDSALSPTYCAALACLHYAIAVKAVEISRYGLLKVGDESWLKKAKKMKELIMNGCGDWIGSTRLSNTKDLLNNREYFIEQSLDLVGQMKNVLIKLDPAYEVLVKLANRPIALRRIDGDTWEKIEEDLAVEVSSADLIQIKLEEVVDLRLIDDCRDQEEWVNQVQKCLSEDKEIEREISKEDIQDFLDMKIREGEIIWSDSTGCMMAI